MLFLGRERETQKILRALGQGENLVLSGKYGIGRTTLIEHVAEIAKERWQFVFVDFSQTPARGCRSLLAELLPKKKNRPVDKLIKYRSWQSLITSLNPKGNRSGVIVFDNIARLSTRKSALIRRAGLGNGELPLSGSDRVG